MKKVSFWLSAQRFCVALAVAFFAVLPLLSMSCRADGDDEETAEQTAEDSSILKCSMEDSSTIKLEIDENYTLVENSVSVKEKDSGDSDLKPTVKEESSENAQVWEISLEEQTSMEKSYVLTCDVADSNGDTQNVSKTFVGFNANQARLILSEVRTNKSGNKLKFIELYVLKGGNLSGLEVVSANANLACSFSDLSCEVKTGSYVTVFVEKNDDGNKKTSLTKKAENENCLELLFKTEKDNFIMKNDVIVLRDSNSKSVIDSVFLASSKNPNWTSNTNAFIKNISFDDIWTSGVDYSGCVDSENAAYNHTISRLNVSKLYEQYKDSDSIPDVIPASKDDWLVVKDATPGEENSSIKYEPKSN